MKDVTLLSTSYLKKIRQRLLRKIRLTGEALSSSDQSLIIDINVELSLRNKE